MSSQQVPHKVLNAFPENSQPVPREFTTRSQRVLNVFPEVQKGSALDDVLSALRSSQLLINV
jgi:hypothetical protein